MQQNSTLEPPPRLDRKETYNYSTMSIEVFDRVKADVSERLNIFDGDPSEYATLLCNMADKIRRNKYVV